MKTMQRPTSAYESARIEEFDDDSRYVIMSDCHRGDGSVSDEFLKNKNVYLAALEHYWKEGFTLHRSRRRRRVVGAQVQAHHQGEPGRLGPDSSLPPRRPADQDVRQSRHPLAGPRLRAGQPVDGSRSGHQ